MRRPSQQPAAARREAAPDEVVGGPRRAESAGGPAQSRPSRGAGPSAAWWPLGTSRERKAAATAADARNEHGKAGPGWPGSRRRGARGATCAGRAARPTKSRKFCKTCERNRPAAVKAQTVHLNKAYGGQVPVVRAAPVTKAAKPLCPNAACRSQASSASDKCCWRCGWAYSAGHAAAAQKSAETWQAGIPGHAGAPGGEDPRPERLADVQPRPTARRCSRRRRRPRQARGQEDAHTARDDREVPRCPEPRRGVPAWRPTRAPRRSCAAC